MARPQIIANGGSPGVKASVAAASAVALTLDDTTGVRSVQWTIVGTDETTSAGDYTIATSGAVGENASLTSLGAGTAAIVRARINNGLDRGRPAPTETTATIKFFVPTVDGLEVGAVGETFESDSLYGTAAILNGPIRALAAVTMISNTTPSKIAMASADTNTVLSGSPTLDGISVGIGQAVLLLNQSDPAENGLWTVAGGPWSRPANFADDSTVRGAVVSVVAGGVRGGFIYQCTNSSAVTVGTTPILFARLPDRADRASLADASSTPSDGRLVEWGSSAELLATSFRPNVANPAGSGLLRGIAQSVLVAARNDANSGDIEALSTQAGDIVRAGGTAAESMQLDVKSGGSIGLRDGGTSFVDASRSGGFLFARTATLRLAMTAPSSGAGSAALIAAQDATTSGNGGELRLRAGAHAGADVPGELVLETKERAGDTSGAVRFVAGASGNYLTILFDDHVPEASIDAPGLAMRISSPTLVLDSASLSLSGSISIVPAAQTIEIFGSVGVGGGVGVLTLANAATPPTSNATGGGILYAEGGALKWRGSAGTVTTIAPA